MIIEQAAVLAAFAVALPYLRGRGPWLAALAGAALLAATALGAPEAALFPLVAAAWVTAGFLLLADRPLERAPAAEPAIEATSASSGPTRNRVSRLRSRETVPTFSPEGL